jgi:hypothetical protein
MPFTKKTAYYTGTVWEWNLPTGSSCPFADQCKVTVDRHTGKFKAEHKAYRCYAANAERFPGVRQARWSNFEAAKAGKLPELPKNCTAVRIHAAGDFFNLQYFALWVEYARARPHVEFWAYTKSIKYWVQLIDQIPANLVLTASYGGREDHLIAEHGLKHVKIYPSADWVPDGVPIDVNDDHARTPALNFALVDNFTK